LTTSSWLTIKSTAIENILIRSEFIQNFMNKVFSVSLRTISRCVVKAKQQKQKLFRTKSDRMASTGSGPSPSSPVIQRTLTRIPSTVKNSSPKNMNKNQGEKPLPLELQFHLRSFRKKKTFCDSWSNPATQRDYSSQAMTEGLISKKLLQEEYYKEKEGGGGGGERNGKTRVNNVNLEYSEDDDRMKRFALLHQQREEEMEIERQRRLQVIEEVSFLPLPFHHHILSLSVSLSLQQKRLREKEALLKQQEELEEKQRLEKMKQDFLHRILTEQNQRARLMKQKRDSKERRLLLQEELLKNEKENEKLELKAMYGEDVRREENLEKQRKKILQFGNRTRPNSASSTHVGGGAPSGVRKKLMSHLNRDEEEKEPEVGTAAAGLSHDQGADFVKKTELPKVPHTRIIKKVVPVISKEEEERLRLEKEEKDREKQRQQVLTPISSLPSSVSSQFCQELREIALKKRLAAKLAQEKEEKEKAAFAEEMKKKEQELVRSTLPLS
jgi:hypothetical protein